MDDESLIHARITNDERPLRRLTRKFHTYVSAAYGLPTPPPPPTNTSVADAREAFLIELASFQLSLQRSLLVCGAESRQVKEYQREKQRVADEHENTRVQIETLKLALEQAQLERRRKIEYDQITERINTLPSREELEMSIAELQSDMQTIHAEHETQDRLLRSRKAALDGIISDITQLRQAGQESLLDETSSAPTPRPEGDGDGAVDTEDASHKANTGVNDDDTMDASAKEGNTDPGEIAEDGTKLSSKAGSPSPQLNPSAKPFRPQTQDSTFRTALRNASGMTTSLSMESRDSTPLGGPNMDAEDDIEMGEVEEIKVKSKKVREDREEGEASDESSELSDPPEAS